MRLMTRPVVVKQAFINGKYSFSEEGTAKYWTWAVIRATGEIKVVKLPFLVAKQITMFSTDPDYEFGDFPMPYDINVNAKNAGVKEVEYVTTAARKNVPVTEDEEATLAKKTPIADILKKMKEKAGVTGEKGADSSKKGDYPQPETDEVPFE